MMRIRLLVAAGLAVVLAAAAMVPASAANPSQILDLRNWRLTIPVDGPDADTSADEIKWPALATYTSQYMHDDGTGHGVTFMAPVAGGAGTGTTPGSSYLRSELREMNGNQEAAWTARDGYLHVMRLTEAFTHTPATKPDVVGAQIHDTGDAIHKAEDVIEIKLSGHRLYIESAGNEVGLLTASYALGTKFNLVVSADLRGVDVTYNGVQKLSNFFPAVTYGTWYFKAGAYTHSTSAIEGDDTAYGETDITELSVQHSPISCSAGGATIQGTDGNDVIHGTAGADLIQAGGGNDIVYGLGGNDIVCGGAGKDLLKGGAGNDKLLGQGGRDKLVGGRGAHDVCTGGGGLDRAKRCEIVRSL